MAIALSVHHFMNIQNSFQLTLYYRSKGKHCERLLEDGLATECYSHSNVNQLIGTRKGWIFYVFENDAHQIKSGDYEIIEFGK